MFFISLTCKRDGILVNVNPMHVASYQDHPEGGGEVLMAVRFRFGESEPVNVCYLVNETAAEITKAMAALEDQALERVKQHAGPDVCSPEQTVRA